MKNGNDNLKEKAMNLSQLESISGGIQAGTSSVKYKNLDYKCFPEQIGFKLCKRCMGACDRGAMSGLQVRNTFHYTVEINPNLCDGCGKCVPKCNCNAIVPA